MDVAVTVSALNGWFAPHLVALEIGASDKSVVLLKIAGNYIGQFATVEIFRTVPDQPLQSTRLIGIAVMVAAPAQLAVGLLPQSPDTGGALRTQPRVGQTPDG